MATQGRNEPVRNAAAAGLGSVLWLTFINSMGTGVVTNGIYFLAKSAYGLGTKGNFALGVVLGLTYIGGAMAVGRLLAWTKRSPNATTRGAFTVLLVACGLLCLVPLGAKWAGLSGAWPAWILVGMYSPLTGCIWPITESYLSGGRRGESLRRALGMFNVVWSFALVVAMWAIGPLVKERPLEVIAVLGVLHVLTVFIVRLLPKEPAAHAHDDYEPHPPVYFRLLSAHRLLLPMGYLIVSTMSPYLPEAFKRMGIATAWHTPLAATWHATRLAGFVWLQRDHRWHGRWWAPVMATVTLVIGFVMVMLAPKFASPTGGDWPIIVFIVGLGLLGLGVATVYTGALYYAMSVGGADVDAGGTHEALIGVGYTVGPGIGLVAAVAIESSVISSGMFEWLVTGAILCLSGATWALVVRRGTGRRLG